MTLKKLEQTAISNLTSWASLLPPGVLDSPPTDLETVGVHWGVETAVTRTLDVAGLLYRKKSGKRVVFLNENDSPGRQRFSWAHELAHIVMAEENTPQISCRKANNVDKQLERSCDVIATAILMPHKPFQEAADRIGWTLSSVRTLATQFQVTMQAAALRILELGNEALMISVWQSGKDPLLGLRAKWSRSNESAKGLRPSIIWKSSPQAIRPLYRAYQTSGVISGSCQVLLTYNKVRNFRPVPSEAVGVGFGNKRSVIGFHYLSRAM